MITATYLPKNVTVQVTDVASDNRYFVRTLDGSEIFTRQTSGGPADYDWAVVARDNLAVIAPIFLPCPHLNTVEQTELRVEYGEPVFTTRLICTDCAEELEPAYDLEDAGLPY